MKIKRIMFLILLVNLLTLISSVKAADKTSVNVEFNLFGGEFSIYKNGNFNDVPFQITQESEFDVGSSGLNLEATMPMEVRVKDYRGTGEDYRIDIKARKIKEVLHPSSGLSPDDLQTLPNGLLTVGAPKIVKRVDDVEVFFDNGYKSSRFNEIGVIDNEQPITLVEFKEGKGMGYFEIKELKFKLTIPHGTRFFNQLNYDPVTKTTKYEAKIDLFLVSGP